MSYHTPIWPEAPVILYHILHDDTFGFPLPFQDHSKDLPRNKHHIGTVCEFTVCAHSQRHIYTVYTV